MPQKANETDYLEKTYNRLTVKKLVGIRNNRTMALFECECGTLKEFRLSDVKLGSIKSCGCLRKEQLIEANTTHGLSNHRLFIIFDSMKSRCNNPNNNAYKDYGGRGIKICEEWLDKEKGFMNFYNWAMGNGYENNLTIERRNVNGNYEPSNCCWATKLQQAHNTRISNKNISGVKGVGFAKHANKWRVKIRTNGNHIHIGYYNTIEEAAAARKAAELKYWGKESETALKGGAGNE